MRFTVLLIAESVEHGIEEELTNPHLLSSPLATTDGGEDGDGDGDGVQLVEVSNPVTAGPAPLARMGHSCVLLPAPGACRVCNVIRCDLGALTTLNQTVSHDPPPKTAGTGADGPNRSAGEPAPRSWRLAVLGGSDGSDLLRSGQELGDAWTLDVACPEAGAGGGGGAPRCTWSEAPLPSPAPWWFPIVRGRVDCLPPPPPRDVDRSFIIFIIIAPINHNHHDTQGRTHTAHHVGGGVLLCFGGGASLSNRVGLLDTASWTFSEPRLLRPQHTGNSDSSSPPGGGALVRPRVSHVAVLAGTRLLVHGGWCRRELNDLLALDLVPGPSGGPGGAATTGARAGGMG